VSRTTKRISTETQGFGVSRRESHNYSKFYSRKLYGQSDITNEESHGYDECGENDIEIQNFEPIPIIFTH
jgi:hypothetical protein